MEQTTFNTFINLQYSDNFDVLNKEENEKYFTGDLLRISFQNREKHILLSLSKTNDSFFNRLVGIKTVVNNTVATLQSGLKDYQFVEEYETTMFDRPAITSCFSYTAKDQDVKQYGELSVFKFKSAFYVVYCISRLENKEDAKKIFKEFTDSFAPAN